MSSILKVQANRRNALLSTGPRTERGKLTASRNAIKHGVTSWRPAMLPWESKTAWERFARPVFEELSPRGPVEMMWAGRIALLMWKLLRAATARKTLVDQEWREAEVLAPKSAWWQHCRERDKNFPETPGALRTTIRRTKEQRALLAAVVSAGTDAQRLGQPVDARTAADLIEYAAGHLNADAELDEAMNKRNRYPGLNTLIEELDVERYRWTLQYVREGLTEVAAWKNETCAGLIATLGPAMDGALTNMVRARSRARRELRNFRRCSAARAHEQFKSLDRYEAELQGNLGKAHTQLRQIQAERATKAPECVTTPDKSVVQMGFVSMETLDKQV